MPPKADSRLEERILRAAERLWTSRGQAGLTLRAVARAAGTTTPTVYKRFRNKKALVVALAERFKAELNSRCFAAPSLQDVYRRYVEFAEENPRKYELLWGTWTDIFHPQSPRPLRAWFLTQVAQRFGGKPEDYARGFYALFLVSHGAATLLTVPGDTEAHAEVRGHFKEICDVLFENISLFRY